MNAALGAILLGIAAGAFSGLVGLGGGIVIIPALVWLFGMSQHEAQGTTLALMVPPIGLLAAWTYYRQGQVNVRIAALVCAGFFFGGLLGARASVGVPDLVLRRLFGAAGLFISIQMIFGR